jgi:ligand-binding sensor domain-containing protein
MPFPRLLLTITLLLSLSPRGYSQGTVVTQLDKEIWRVFHARNGDYWFGSPTTGLYRYDGKTLVNYTSKDGIGFNHVSGFQEDPDGLLYINTAGDYDKKLRRYHQAISRFDGKTFTRLTMPDREAPAGTWKLEPGDLWFGGAGDTGEMLRYDGKTLHRLIIPKTEAGQAIVEAHPRTKYPNIKSSPYDPYVHFTDSRGHLWIGTANLGACRFDGKTFTWLPESELHNGSFGTRSVVEDKDGKFWFCHATHRYTVDPGSSTFQRADGMLDNKDPKKPLTGGIMSGVKDNDGVLWLATYGDGVWRYDGKTATRYPVKDGDRETRVYLITKDRQGGIWLGTQNAGAYRFNGKGFEQFRP